MNDVKKLKIFTVHAINVTLLMLCFAMSINLYTEGVSQKIFYIAGYICFFLTIANLFLGSEKYSLTRAKKFFILSVLLIGLVRLFWVLYIQHIEPQLSVNALSILRNYFLGGKRFILGVFIICSIMLYGKEIKANTISLCKLIIFGGIVLALAFGIHEYFYVTHQRIKLTADAASSSSYMVVFIYCAYLWLSRSHTGLKWRAVDVVFVMMSFALIILCGTRVTILSFIMVTVYHLNCAFGLTSLLRSKTNIIIGLLAIVAVFAFSAQRWSEGLRNIENYKHNSSTSIGARFAIWESGIDFIQHNSGFSSPDVRTVSARAFIKETQPDNFTGYNNVKYNMHNEFLEVFTLQGWLGFLTLALLYVVFLSGKLFKSDVRGIALPVIALFISGLTDSVLIYAQTVMIFIMALAICSIRIHHPAEARSSTK